MDELEFRLKSLDEEEQEKIQMIELRYQTAKAYISELLETRRGEPE
jgi:hypothetical protein